MPAILEDKRSVCSECSRLAAADADIKMACKSAIVHEWLAQ